MYRILLEIPIPFTRIHIPIFSYGFMIMLAFVVGLLLARKRAGQAGINPEVIMDIGLYSIVCGIVGSRIAFLITDFRPNPASDNPLLDMVAIWKGGLTFQGGLLLAIVVCVWYLNSRKLNAAQVADIFAPSLAIGIALGRMGCFLNGCCWGRICPADFPLSIRFGEASSVAKHHMDILNKGELIPLLNEQHYDTLTRSIQHTLEQGNADVMERLYALLGQIHIHPTQLYTSAAMAVVFAIVLWLSKRPRAFHGQIMLAFLALYSAVRFSVEFLRDDTPLMGAIGSFPGLRLGQYLSLLTFVAVLWIYKHLSGSAKTTEEQDLAEKT